jgi:tetratricopeptide (TPR) repeat protein
LRIDALDSDQRSAVELLALAGDLDLDLAFDLVEDEVLDQLEFDGLIVVREGGPDSRVELAHPLYGEILVAHLPALRARRHRARLEKALGDRATAGTADRLLFVRLQLDAGSDIDDQMLLESAGLAFAQEHTGLALRLLDQVPAERRTGRHELLRGEALYMRGRFDEAGATWQGLDVDQLDDASAAVLVRRLATWQFHAKWRHTEALETLRSRLDRFEGDAFHEVESYWVELASLDGRWADEAIERAERSMAEAGPHATATYLSGAAMGRFLHGEHRAALGLIERRRRLDQQLDEVVLWQGPGYSNFVAAAVLTELGDIDGAWKVLDHLDGSGAVPSFGYEGIAAGRLALRSGRYEQVLDWLDPHIQLAEALGITTNGRPLQATTALAALELGDLDRAQADVAALRSELPEAPGVVRLDILWAVHIVEAVTDDAEVAARALLEAASVARSAGLAVVEAMLVSAAISAMPSEEGRGHLERLAGRVDGEFIALRLRAARARLGIEDGLAVAGEVDALGLRWDAAQIRRWAS